MSDKYSSELDKVLTALLWRVPVQYINNRAEAKAKLEALLQRVEVERIKRIQRGANVLDKDGIMAFLELELLKLEEEE